MAKEFHLGDVLSAASDILMSPRGMEGLYDILGYMSGESLMTHQLLRVAKEAKPVLLRLHPFLANIDLSHVDRSNITETLDALVLMHGETLPVITMTEDEHERIDPMSEAAEIFPPDQIINAQA